MTLNKIVLCTCHFFVLLLLQFVIANCNNGFSLKLIHRDSEESPLYPGNLTLEERVERLHQQSNARLNYYLAKIADDAIVDVDDQFRNLQPEMVSSRLTFYLDSFYLAKIGLGTFDHSPQQPNNYQSYYLIVDTGSELTWTQCEPCKGFPQAQPVFPPSKSKSYRLLSCNKHSLCYRDICQHGYCSYAMKYMTNQSSYGYLGIDRFTFELENGNVESIDGLVFGCGHTQQNFKINSTRNPINGILGMGTGPRSLINQLGNRARGKFSYCIPRWKFPTDKIYLRFGNEAEFRQGLHFSTTPFIQGQALPTYYVRLLDISVAGNRLHFPPGFFDIKQDGTGGCFIDSGSPFSYLPQGAYLRVRDAVASYWAQIHLPVKQKPGYDLCYQVPRRDQQPPPIIFHFLNADLIVGSGAYISYVNDAICFAFKSSEDHGGVSIIGALAQSDYRFLFDLATKTLSFARDDCRKNP